MIMIQESEYLRSCEELSGYCLSCDDITNSGGVEPDAEEYACEVCGEPQVMGIEQALLCGHIGISEG